MKHLTTFDSKEVFESVKEQLAKPNISIVEDAIISLSVPTYEMVDLGLPSGLKWAKCNIGAEKETDYGKYFKFGDVVGTVDGAGYDSSIPAVEVDSDNHLLPAYDAATVNMGEGYRMPTKEELDELVYGTYHAFKTIDGVRGIKFSKKGDPTTYIFVPLAGYSHSDYVGNFAGTLGLLWSSIRGDNSDAYVLDCDSDGRTNTHYFNRN